jgi:hypothetical protein
MNFPALARAARNTHLWLPGYLRERTSRPKLIEPAHVWLLLADHFEPGLGNAGLDTMLERVRPWSKRWPEIARRQTDSDGCPAQYTFFYPEEQYHPQIIDSLARMVEAGVGDVEVHIHHDGEGERNFVDRMSWFTSRLHASHGLLRKTGGRVVFGFIHGNWALDNALPNGRWCGLNNEISLLRDLGCYADFTLPSAPSPAQTKIVNTIYWADDDPCRPRSHDRGRAVRVGEGSTGDLLLVPGPLGLSFRGSRLLPRIENGELASYYPVTGQRVKRWLDLAPRIGRDIFVKLFMHGAREDNAAALLGRDLELALSTVRQQCVERGWTIHFVSAWRMRQAIEAARLNAGPLQAVVEEAAPV